MAPLMIAGGWPDRGPFRQERKEEMGGVEKKKKNAFVILSNTGEGCLLVGTAFQHLHPTELTKYPFFWRSQA